MPSSQVADNHKEHWMEEESDEKRDMETPSKLMETM